MSSQSGNKERGRDASYNPEIYHNYKTGEAVTDPYGAASTPPKPFTSPTVTPILANFNQGKYEDVITFFDDKNGFLLPSEALSVIAEAFGKLERYEEAIEVYKILLARFSENQVYLNNIGYYMGIIGQYEKAIYYLDLAVRINPLWAFPFNNRGIAKIRIGLMEDGLADIRHSMSLDSENSYAYMNLGIYYLLQKDYKQAGFHFQMAYQLNPDTTGLDTYKKFYG